MPPNEKEFAVRNRISVLSTALPVRPGAASAAELTASVQAAWSSSERKRKRIAAELIRRRLSSSERTVPLDR